MNHSHHDKKIRINNLILINQQSIYFVSTCELLISFTNVNFLQQIKFQSKDTNDIFTETFMCLFVFARHSKMEVNIYKNLDNCRYWNLLGIKILKDQLRLCKSLNSVNLQFFFIVHYRIPVVFVVTSNWGFSNFSQFFITLGDDLDYLDGQHTVFGEVVEGFEVLDKINDAICDDEHRPYQDIR